MTEPWAAEREVDAALCRQLVRDQLRLRADRVEPFGAGWDNTAYLVDGEWVVRFPRREVAVPLLEAETRLLPRLAGALPLPVPLPELVGRPSDAFPWPFAGYRRLPGRSVSEAALAEAQRRRLAGPLGELLRALHAIEPATLELPPDRFGKLDVGRLQRELGPRLATARDRGLADAALLRSAERLAAAGAPPARPVRRVVHGDLYSLHLLVDDDGRPCGVIDWGDVHANDPAVDLIAFLLLLPPQARSAALARYGEVPPESWRLAALRAVFHAVTELVYAADIGDVALRREAQVGLGLALAPLPG